MAESIPFITPDLTAAEAQAASEVVLSGQVNEGALTHRFEAAWAETVGARYAVATTSCTASLAVALMALGIKAREVIVPDVTMIGTAMAVVLSGNTPVVVDVDPDTGCLDAHALRHALTSRTAAILPVHLNGRNALTRAVLDVVRAAGLPIVEDAACCLGSRSGEEASPMLGTLGELGCYSLAATKIATTGQGGVLVTNDARLYERATRLKDWGRFGPKGTSHPEVGFNFKFTDIQAAIGLAQLKRLPQLVARKRAIEARYRQRLGEWMLRPAQRGACPWYVEVRAQHLAEALGRHGIGCVAMWPALHQQGAMRAYVHETDPFAQATRLAAEVLWLPTSTTLTDAQIDRVCEAFLASARAGAPQEVAAHG